MQPRTEPCALDAGRSGGGGGCQAASQEGHQPHAGQVHLFTMKAEDSQALAGQPPHPTPPEPPRGGREGGRKER